MVNKTIKAGNPVKFPGILAASTVELRKHSGPSPTDDMSPEIISDCGNFPLDFKQRGFVPLTLDLVLSMLFVHLHVYTRIQPS